MDAIKGFINFIMDPRLYFLGAVGALVLLVWKRERFVEKSFGYGLLGFLGAFFIVGSFDPNFRLIITKPDNVPIVGLIFCLVFFVWYALREAVLNAVSHRDYRHGASVFVRQYPRRIEIVSPGGFPPGINEQNLLWEQHPRNRRIAEVLSKCGLVERSGQGFDLIYRACIQQSKLLPDFSRTSEHAVWLTLYGEIQDQEFLRFLEEVGREHLATFSTEDFLVVDLIHRQRPVPTHLVARLSLLLNQGVIERVGRGRGVRYLLSRRFYRFLGKGGVYTRQRGLDRETNKALLVQHIEDSAATGTRLEELQQVLPGLSRHQVQTLLRELKRDRRIKVEGVTKAARWFPDGQKHNPTQ